VTSALIPLLLKRGGDAFIVEHAGDAVCLASTASSPPGSTLEASFAGPRSVTVRVKVRGCRRASLPDGREGFRIEGRFVSLTRGDREALFAAPAASAAPAESDSGSTSET